MKNEVRFCSVNEECVKTLESSEIFWPWRQLVDVIGQNITLNIWLLISTIKVSVCNKDSSGERNINRKGGKLPQKLNVEEVSCCFSSIVALVSGSSCRGF